MQLIHKTAFKIAGRYLQKNKLILPQHIILKMNIVTNISVKPRKIPKNVLVILYNPLLKNTYRPDSIIFVRNVPKITNAKKQKNIKIYIIKLSRSSWGNPAKALGLLHNPLANKKKTNNILSFPCGFFHQEKFCCKNLSRKATKFINSGETKINMANLPRGNIEMVIYIAQFR